MEVVGGLQHMTWDSSDNTTSLSYIGPAFDICEALSPNTIYLEPARTTLLAGGGAVVYTLTVTTPGGAVASADPGSVLKASRVWLVPAQRFY